MKKYIISIVLGAALILGITNTVTAQQNANSNIKFSDAIKTCENYSKDGAIEYEGQLFNILITLQKRGDTCIYKEKIYQGKDYQMLTCNFDKSQLAPISTSMAKYNNIFKKEISKNPIFEAKMTTNGEVFQNYLANPKFCSISHSKK